MYISIFEDSNWLCYFLCEIVKKIKGLGRKGYAMFLISPPPSSSIKTLHWKGNKCEIKWEIVKIYTAVHNFLTFNTFFSCVYAERCHMSYVKVVWSMVSFMHFLLFHSSRWEKYQMATCVDHTKWMIPWIGMHESSLTIGPLTTLIRYIVPESCIKFIVELTNRFEKYIV